MKLEILVCYHLAAKDCFIETMMILSILAEDLINLNSWFVGMIFALGPMNMTMFFNDWSWQLGRLRMTGEDIYVWKLYFSANVYMCFTMTLLSCCKFFFTAMRYLFFLSKFTTGRIFFQFFIYLFITSYISFEKVQSALTIN